MMNVDIYIREKNGTKKIRVPWLPTSVSLESGGATVATYDILDKGTVEVPTASGLAKIKWESQFPGKNRTDTSLMRGPWNTPESYHRLFEKWLREGTALNVLITSYPVNLDVYLSNYTCTPGGGFGDIEYTVEFTELRVLQLKSTIKEKTDQNATNKREEATYDTYTVKKGDTLWGIAKRTLGSGSLWEKIYDANSTIIESTAKAHGKKSSSRGHWIYPGTKLQIPKS